MIELLKDVERSEGIGEKRRREKRWRDVESEGGFKRSHACQEAEKAHVKIVKVMMMVIRDKERRRGDDDGEAGEGREQAVVKIVWQGK